MEEETIANTAGAGAGPDTKDMNGTSAADAALLLLQQNNNEDVDEVDEVMEDVNITNGQQQQQQQQQYAILLGLDHLPTSILTPSPFPQHNDSSRFRTAYQRITKNPYDTEAWQAVMTEASQCAGIATSPAQFAWVVSCFGTVLHSFPYAVTHITGIVEILLDHRGHCKRTFSSLVTPQQLQHQTLIREYCERQLQQLFAKYLGVVTKTKDDDNKSETAKPKIVLCAWVVDLWLLYIRKVREDDGDIEQAFALAASRGAGDAYNNHVFWKAYTEATALNTNISVRRHVFQQLVVRPMTGLDQYWHQYEQLEAQHPPVGAQLIAEFQPKYQSARTAYLEHAKVMKDHDLQYGRMDVGSGGGGGGGADAENTTTAADDDEDDAVMTAWLWKTSFERTRKTSMTVCRQWYCQMVCTLSRHPEAWYMFATYDTANAVAIWDQAMHCIPDSTLLAYCRASATPETSVDVLAQHVASAPTSLGFLLLQQAVRRTQTVEAARRVFAQARRVLETTNNHNNNKSSVAATTEDAEQEEGKDTTKNDTETAAGNNENVASGTDSQIVKVKHRAAAVATTTTEAPTEPAQQQTPSYRVPPGPMTWHVYAAHATMEQYQNKAPDVAAKVYALGLRTHHTWITIPAYIRRYASLLTDSTAVRALWQRAVAAAANGPTRAALYEGWLETEALLGGADPMTLAGSLQAERYNALHGEKPDVVTGKWLAEPSGPTIMGAQKITVAEYLIRERGLEESANIAFGLNRVIDTLSALGAWGDGRPVIGDVPEDDKNEGMGDAQLYPGGASDIAMQKRLRRRNRPDMSHFMAGPGASALALNKPSARDRLTGGPQGGTAILMMIQQSPDWLRPLLLLLPASKTRQAMVAKPPPHLTEMALSTLQKSSLPAERPIERKRNRNGDSSDDDDDDGTPQASGYGIAFRKRQQARMVENGIAAGMLQ